MGVNYKQESIREASSTLSGIAADLDRRRHRRHSVQAHAWTEEESNAGLDELVVLQLERPIVFQFSYFLSQRSPGSLKGHGIYRH